MNNIQEQWKPVRGFEGYYSVSNTGRVRREWVDSYGKSGSHPIKSYITKLGYPMLHLMRDGKRTTAHVHRLMMEAFAWPPPEPNYEVNHKDGNRANNALENLEWVSKSENHKHRFSVLGQIPTRGSRHGFATFTENQVLEIRKLYAEGMTQAELARKFKTNPVYVHHIVHRHTWRHI